MSSGEAENIIKTQRRSNLTLFGVGWRQGKQKKITKTMADRHTTEKLLEGERLSGKVTLFAKVTILPGDELPYHEHHGETEAYHILSGAGMYQDNDKTYPVQAGMTTFCEDGSGHAVSCAGEEPLVFLAMIQKKVE